MIPSADAARDEAFGHRLVIEEDWSALPETPKSARMLRRRDKTLGMLPSYRRHVRILASLLDEPEIRRGPIVEVASGTGFHLLELGRLGFDRLIATEIDPSLSRLTESAARRFGVNLRSVAGDACAIPMADGSCAAVISHSFFEHVYDVGLALREQIRVLRPGGRLLIFDGNLLNPKLLTDLLVFYPLRTRGRHGGLRWLFQKRKVHKNLYGYLPLGRDEDVKTPRWWRRRIAQEPELELLYCGTGGAFLAARWPSFVQAMIGSCIVIARKRPR